MVQATACRAVIYGFNSHPQLLITFDPIVSKGEKNEFGRENGFIKKSSYGRDRKRLD